MSTRYDQVKGQLSRERRKWLVTGVAGFIGSNLLEALLRLDQEVVGLDNFATGHWCNLEEVCALVGPRCWSRFRLVEGDIRDLETCRAAVAGVQNVLHQAALGSVPRSIEDPITSNTVNIGGFLNVLVAAREEGVESFVYAASSSAYGDHPDLPKVEDKTGSPLSPYAVTKVVNELYADVFRRTYDFASTGLRYFNVFGPRQDPNGPYAAVIPRWLAAMLRGDAVDVYGDGETSRDFCYVENAVQANLLAALAESEAVGEVYNVAVHGRTSLNALREELRRGLAEHGIFYDIPARHADFRPGDVRHSQADIGKAARRLGYEPTHSLRDGIAELVAWQLGRVRPGLAGAPEREPAPLAMQAGRIAS